jgi:hypothetical protein
LAVEQADCRHLSPLLLGSLEQLRPRDARTIRTGCQRREDFDHRPDAQIISLSDLLSKAAA